MILAIDIGNSSVSCGVYKACVGCTSPALHIIPECVCRFKIAAKPMSADEYLLTFTQFLSLYRIRPSSTCLSASHTDVLVSDGTLNACVISSVVPALTDTIAQTAQILTGTQPLIIGHGIRTGFGIKIQNPEQLGADIVSNVSAAFLYTKPPFVVLDIGTATTITYVNNSGILTGTIIIPGLAVSMEALSESAALLNHVTLEKPQTLLGKNTSESVQSGVIGGHVLMIDGFLRNIREQFLDPGSNEKLGLIASGGLAGCVLPLCRNKFQYVSDLTLLGAVTLYQKAFPDKSI